MAVDNSVIYLPGPWRHEFVSANGCQFHLARAGEFHEDRPLVLLVHGFPECWYAWRSQIATIAQAGYDVAAMDMRGICGSDKTATPYDSQTLATDILALGQSLGYSRLALIGHGFGGQLAWGAASYAPARVAGILTISAPHPRALQRIGTHFSLSSWKFILSTLAPSAGASRLKDASYLSHLLSQWSAPGNTAAAQAADIYARSFALPQSAQNALGQLRWIYRGIRRPAARRYFKMTARAIPVPVWSVRGESDPLLRSHAWQEDALYTTHSWHPITISNAGHFPHEEQSKITNRAILDFLDSLSR